MKELNTMMEFQQRLTVSQLILVPQNAGKNVVFLATHVYKPAFWGTNNLQNILKNINQSLYHGYLSSLLLLAPFVFRAPFQSSFPAIPSTLFFLR